jgi:hypothetical protein
MPEPQAAPSLSHRTRAAAAGRWRPHCGDFAGALLAALVLAKLLHHEHAAQAMLHPPRQTLARRRAEQARKRCAGSAGRGFATSDGLLPGLVPALAQRRGGGLRARRPGNRSWFLDQARALAQRGLGVLLYDSRANGESEGDPELGRSGAEDLTRRWTGSAPAPMPTRAAWARPASRSARPRSAWSPPATSAQGRAARQPVALAARGAAPQGRLGLGAWLLRCDFWWAGWTSTTCGPSRPSPASRRARCAWWPARSTATPRPSWRSACSSGRRTQGLGAFPGADHLDQRELGGAAQRGGGGFFAESL